MGSRFIEPQIQLGESTMFLQAFIAVVVAFIIYLSIKYIVFYCTAMNARASENYLAISRSSSASKSVEIFWAEIYWGRLIFRAESSLIQSSLVLVTPRNGKQMYLMWTVPITHLRHAFIQCCASFPLLRWEYLYAMAAAIPRGHEYQTRLNETRFGPKNKSSPIYLGPKNLIL
jgi:hypothetical protein